MAQGTSGQGGRDGAAVHMLPCLYHRAEQAIRGEQLRLRRGEATSYFELASVTFFLSTATQNYHRHDLHRLQFIFCVPFSILCTLLLCSYSPIHTHLSQCSQMSKPFACRDCFWRGKTS